MRPIAALLLAVVAALVMLGLPSAASADSFDDVFAQYRKTGRIDPCAFTPQQLRQARREVPNDIKQYAPDFPDALDRALAARAKRGCGRRPQAPAATAEPEPAGAPPAPPSPPAAATPPQPTPGGATPQPTPQPVAAAAVSDEAIPVAAARREGDADTPAALVLLAILGGGLLLGMALWGAARWWAWEPAWLVRTRHASAEAGWRASAAWAEFADWVRLGR